MCTQRVKQIQTVRTSFGRKSDELLWNWRPNYERHCIWPIKTNAKALLWIACRTGWPRVRAPALTIDPLAIFEDQVILWIQWPNLFRLCPHTQCSPANDIIIIISMADNCIWGFFLYFSCYVLIWWHTKLLYRFYDCHFLFSENASAFAIKAANLHEKCPWPSIWLGYLAFSSHVY